MALRSDTPGHKPPFKTKCVRSCYTSNTTLCYRRRSSRAACSRERHPRVLHVSHHRSAGALGVLSIISLCGPPQPNRLGKETGRKGTSTMASKALASVKSWLAKLPIKAPWKMIGVASSPEFQDYLPPATEYRARAPGSQPIRPIVPAALPERVYDIKYWVRDTRRQGQLVGGTNKKHMVKHEVDVHEGLQLAEGDAPPTIGKPYRWNKKHNLLDYDNNGYT